MDVTKVQDVVEAIKTLNLNFDGKLNSETLVQIAENIMPYFWMLQIKSLVVHIIWAVAIVASAYCLGKALLKLSKED